MVIHPIDGLDLTGKAIVLKKGEYIKNRLYRVIHSHNHLQYATHVWAQSATTQSGATSVLFILRLRIEGWITDEDAEKYIMWEALFTQ